MTNKNGDKETATMTSESLNTSESPNAFIYNEETKDEIPRLSLM
jgi:hypothetical protein